MKADEIGKWKVGDKVKVTQAAGTMDAEKIVPLGKKAVKKEIKKAKLCDSLRSFQHKISGFQTS